MDSGFFFTLVQYIRQVTFYALIQWCPCIMLKLTSTSLVTNFTHHTIFQLVRKTFNLLVVSQHQLMWYNSLWLEDDYRTGCRNVSHCQQQQSYSQLRSPGRSNSNYFCCINVMHFAQSTVLGYHSIPKSNWGSFGDQFRDRFRVGDHFRVRIVSRAVQNFAKGCK